MLTLYFKGQEAPQFPVKDRLVTHFNNILNCINCIVLLGIYIFKCAFAMEYAAEASHYSVSHQCKGPSHRALRLHLRLFSLMFAVT